MSTDYINLRKVFVDAENNLKGHLHTCITHTGVNQMRLLKDGSSPTNTLIISCNFYLLEKVGKNKNYLFCHTFKDFEAQMIRFPNSYFNTDPLFKEIYRLIEVFRYHQSRIDPVTNKYYHEEISQTNLDDLVKIITTLR